MCMGVGVQAPGGLRDPGGSLGCLSTMRSRNDNDIRFKKRPFQGGEGRDEGKLMPKQE